MKILNVNENYISINFTTTKIKGAMNFAKFSKSEKVYVFIVSL